jgi:hypothetical protein
MNPDWLPGRREDILAMANNWVHVLMETTPPGCGVPTAGRRNTFFWYQQGFPVTYFFRGDCI